MTTMFIALNEVLEKPEPEAVTRMAATISRALKLSSQPIRVEVNHLNHIPKPVLQCACHRDAALKVSQTSRNSGRRFFKCASNTCYCWYWEDLVSDYMQQLQSYAALQRMYDEEGSTVDWTEIQSHDDLWTDQLSQLSLDFANLQVDDPSPDSSLHPTHFD